MKNATTKTTGRIESRNEGWGFYGTTINNERCSDSQAASDFHAAARAMMAAYRCTADEAREILDGRGGRHAADQRREGEGAGEVIKRLRTHGGWAGFFRDHLKEIRTR